MKARLEIRCGAITPIPLRPSRRKGRAGLETCPRGDGIYFLTRGRDGFFS
jgi:hypothetical protein